MLISDGYFLFGLSFIGGSMVSLPLAYLPSFVETALE